MIDLIRIKIISVVEGAIKRFSGYGRQSEQFTNREFLQQYGLSSRPLADAEGICLKKGNQIFLIATDDRRYRVALEEGEVAIFTDEGDVVHLKRGNEILIQTGKLTVEASTEVEITAPAMTLTGDVAIVGDVEVTGAIEATGDITSDGSITDATGNTNHHSHT